jgi:hypothetical protein
MNLTPALSTSPNAQCSAKEREKERERERERERLSKLPT